MLEKMITVEVGDSGGGARTLREMVSEPETGTEPSTTARNGPLPSQPAGAVGAAASRRAPPDSAEEIWVAVDCGGGSTHSYAGGGGGGRVVSLTGTGEHLTGGSGDGDDVEHVGDQLRMSWSVPDRATRRTSAGAEAVVAAARAGAASPRPRTEASRASGAKRASGLVAPEIKLEIACVRVVPPVAARVRADKEGPTAVAGSGAPISAISGGRLSAVARGGRTARREGIDREATSAIACALPVTVACPDGSSAAAAAQGEIGAIEVSAADGGVEAGTASPVAIASAGAVTTNPPNVDDSGRDTGREINRTIRPVAAVGAAAAAAAAASAAGIADAREPVTSHVEEQNTLCEPGRDVGSPEKPCHLFLQIIGPAPLEAKVNMWAVYI